MEKEQAVADSFKSQNVQVLDLHRIQLYGLEKTRHSQPAFYVSNASLKLWLTGCFLPRSQSVLGVSHSVESTWADYRLVVFHNDLKHLRGEHSNELTVK